MITGLAAWATVPATSVTAAPPLEQACVKAGLVPPVVKEAVMEHPGSKRGRLQSVSTSIEVPAMPEECWGIYQRLSAAVTQIQDPLHHARWYNTSGCRFTAKECVGISKPNWWQLSWAKDEGGIAGLYSPPTGHEGKFLYYACTPGKGVTHVRLLLRRTIRSVSTHQVIGRSRINVRPVEVRGRKPC
ncbi:MAG TPA: hypothetical protein VLL27_13500 [Solirubrobacterales bacterium]|nr:hypothetical protein [Solirubrobacterales bacterium]